MRIALFLLLAVPGLALADHHKGKSLFNGKDLTGWKVPEGNIWWAVEDGAIMVKSGPKKKGSILWTKESFKDFDFTCEFNFDGTGDSGVFIRDGGQQIQIGISGSLKRDMTASPYIASSVKKITRPRQTMAMRFFFNRCQASLHKLCDVLSIISVLPSDQRPHNRYPSRDWRQQT